MQSYMLLVSKINSTPGKQFKLWEFFTSIQLYLGDFEGRL